ncbi:hypothetical protein HDR61_04050 [bacterium]|nr:hypothetical protein [bacterium]
MLYKSALKAFLLSALGLIGVFIAVVYIRDPYMLFHRGWNHNNKIGHDFRVQNYGLIKYEPMDSIIIGTSMLENTSAAQASELLGGTFVNLSFSAATHYEKKCMLDFAFAHRDIKRVIVSMDFEFNAEKSAEGEFHDNVYINNTFYDRFMVYMNPKMLGCIFGGVECALRTKDLDRPRAWFKHKGHARRFGGFENWMKYRKDLPKNPILTDSSIAKYKQVVDNEIVSLFENRNVQFDLIIPPYSVLWLARTPDTFDIAMTPYEYLIQRAAEYDNVTIYWFYDESYVFDIARYKDLTHYDADVNVHQLNAIANQTNIINVDNYQEKFRKLRHRLDTFDSGYYLKQLYPDK